MSLKGTLSNLITFKVIDEYGKGALIEILTVFWPFYYVSCQGVICNGTFLAFIKPPISEFVISEIYKR